MRNLRLLVACTAIFALLFAVSCSDDGGNPNTETNCSDGVDNDQDGLPDCLDSDCAGAPDCQSCGNSLCEVNLGENATTCPADCGGGTCGDTICNNGETFATCPADCPDAPVCGDNICEGDETTTCPADCAGGQCAAVQDLLDQNGCPGEACTVDPSNQTIGCAAVGTNADYADCSGGEGCLAGSLCANDGTNVECHPFCEPGGDPCPGGGSCMFEITTTVGNVGLCGVPTNNCDPVDNTGCTAPEECFLTGGGANCIAPTATPAQPGSPCDGGELSGCVTGSSCINTGTESLCFEMCNLSDGTGCDTGTCQDTLGDATFGTCG